MELRQLEAFAAVAAELHFGRAAQSLHMGQSAVSELVQRLERELGTPLFTRTTRRVALTSAGTELLARTKTILDDVADAAAAVRRIAEGDGGTVRVGVTPPAAPVLAPYLREAFRAQAPAVTVDIQRMWLSSLTDGVAQGTIDVAITCGLVVAPAGAVSEVFCAEPLLVGLRKQHRLATRERVALADLAYDVLGTPNEALFPAWALSQKQVLEAARITPPSVDLETSDVTAARWTEQPEVDWVMLIPSLASPDPQTVVRQVEPAQLVPFTLQWNPDRAQTAAVARFVHCALTTKPPLGWYTQPAHLHHAPSKDHAIDQQTG